MIKLNHERLNEFLAFRRWNQTDLAKAMKYSESYIALVMSDARLPSREFMARLVDITGLSLDELFFCQKTYQNVGKTS